MPQCGQVAIPSDRLAEQIDTIFAERSAAAAKRAAEIQALLAEQRHIEAEAIGRLRRTVQPLLDKAAALLRAGGLGAEVELACREGETPRLTLRLHEPNHNGNGPPNLMEACLHFTIERGYRAVSIREEAWRWRLGGSRVVTGSVSVEDLENSLIEGQIIAFVRHALLDPRPPADANPATVSAAP